MRIPVEKAPLVYRSTDAGAHWRSVAPPGLAEVDALDAIGESVWLVATRERGGRPSLFQSNDAGSTWREIEIPRALVDVTALHRVSVDTAYATTMGRENGPALWRTINAGRNWTVVPTPHDEGLNPIPAYGDRVEEIATVGRWLVVREFGRVFATPTATVHWHAMPSIDRVASERGQSQVFVLMDSLRPAVLDSDLHSTWHAPSPLALHDQGIEQVLIANGRGYVSTSYGHVIEARPGVGVFSNPPEAH
jgi:photosystem II stability/assembly factor-like uncharacterized protein